MKHLRRNFHFKKIDSTSAYVMRRRFALRNFSVVSTDFQTAGKGRENREWKSDQGKNLLFSIYISDKRLCKMFNYLSIGTAIGVINCLKKIGLKYAMLKWPNDVYYKDKKICGILLESISNDSGLCALCVGVGINVNQKEFVGNFNTSPTSISLELNKDINVKKLKKLIVKYIKIEFNKIAKNDFSCIENAKTSNYLLNKTVYCEINGLEKQVTVKDIDSYGKLIVNDGEKDFSVFTGEITFHIK